MKTFLFFGLLVAVATVDGLSCKSCHNVVCQNVDCPGSKVMDPCGCCEECTKQVDESCGGLYNIMGVCDKGLTCFVDAKSGSNLENGGYRGICKAVAENCDTVSCSVHSSPTCPSDSVLAEGFTPPGQCCPLRGKCECRPQKCKHRLCRPNQERVLIRKATGVPGLCCDVYECRARNDACASVRCAPVREVTCPEDSSIVTGQRSRSGCCLLQPRCECDATKCVVLTCAPGSIPRRITKGNKKPGSCCDTHQCVNVSDLATCDVNGKHLNHGEKYHRGLCELCTCFDGEPQCSRKQCPKLTCTKRYTPPGECCQKCKITIKKPPVTNAPTQVCFSSGRFYGSGDKWKLDDCTTCACVDGQRRCIAQACQVTCANPRKVPGVCCGVCDEPTIIEVPSDLSCPSMDGCKLICDSFALDKNGCKKCECANENCLPMKCPDTCANGYQHIEVDKLGCRTCSCKPKQCKDNSKCSKQCHFGFLKDAFGCDRCKCRSCPDISDCKLTCVHGKKRVANPNKLHHGCEICECKDGADESVQTDVNMDKCSTRNYGIKEHMETWNTSDGTACMCRSGSEYCEVFHKMQRRAEARLTCDVVGVKDEHIKPVAMFGRPNDLCFCKDNIVLCEVQICPPTPCENPVQGKELGCQVCPDAVATPTEGRQCIDRDGVQHNHKSSWKTNQCTSCKCVDGSTSCHATKCESLSNCKQVVRIPGKCCPVCIDATTQLCEAEGQTYNYGESYEADCKYCTCGTGECIQIADCGEPYIREATSQRWFPYAIGGAIVFLCLIIMITMFVIMCKRGRCSIQRNPQTKYSPGMHNTDTKY